MKNSDTPNTKDTRVSMTSKLRGQAATETAAAEPRTSWAPGRWRFRRGKFHGVLGFIDRREDGNGRKHTLNQGYKCHGNDPDFFNVPLNLKP